MKRLGPVFTAVFVVFGPGCDGEGAEAPEAAPPPTPAGDATEVGSFARAVIGPNDVGVIAPAGMNCPNEHIMVALENEREGNWNEKEGWLGATQQDRAWTRFHLCRVDGRNFRRVRGTSTTQNYAVVKLGASCPAGSVDFERYFDNEDRPRGCPSWPWACGVGKPATIGDFAPSSYSANNLHLRFCLFRAALTGDTRPLPAIGIPYGVFAAPGFPGAIASGWVHTDDEDDDNANRLLGDAVGSSGFLTAGGNTTLRMVQVNPLPLLLPVFEAAQLSADE